MLHNIPQCYECQHVSLSNLSDSCFSVEPDEFLLQARGADSGVGENEDEEWVSDTEVWSHVLKIFDFF